MNFCVVFDVCMCVCVLTFSFRCILYIIVYYSICFSFMITKYSRRGSKWSRVAPRSIGERSAVLSKCGRRCFLGSEKTFPICARLGSVSSSNTCKINRLGVQAAYIRAREWASITARKKYLSKKSAHSHRRYTAIARKAKSILSK